MTNEEAAQILLGPLPFRGWEPIIETAFAQIAYAAREDRLLSVVPEFTDSHVIIKFVMRNKRTDADIISERVRRHFQDLR